MGPGTSFIKKILENYLIFSKLILWQLLMHSRVHFSINFTLHSRVHFSINFTLHSRVHFSISFTLHPRVHFSISFTLPSRVHFSINCYGYVQGSLSLCCNANNVWTLTWIVHFALLYRLIPRDSLFPFIF